MTLSKFDWSLFAPGDQTLVAVSGGPDSLSLLHALHAGREGQGLAGVAAAHLDHGLRGAESAAEAAWVAQWCAGRGIPCHVSHADVAALARESRRSKMEAARTARYQFLEQVAAQVGATKIATGHTRDDQVETVLLHIARGTGLDGLRGIPAARGPYVRPLLGVSRAEIEAYCAQHGLTPRRDPSNLSAAYSLRNRVRLELLPLLAREYNPGIGAALLRLSEIAGGDKDYLRQQAEASLRFVTRERESSCWTLDRAALAALHPALLRHVLRAAVAQSRGTLEDAAYRQIERVRQAVSDPAAPVFSVTFGSPACIVRGTETTLTLSVAGALPSPGYVSKVLPVPGEAFLPEIGWRVRADYESGSIALDAGVVQGSALTLRNWMAGDKIAPLGMGGHHKKVSDIFGEAKIPRTERTRIPIVADEAGIVWIVGHTLADRVKVTRQTTHRLFLTATRLREMKAGKQNAPAE